MEGARQKQRKQLNIREGFYFMEVCDQVQAINIVLREKDIPLHVFIEPRRISTQSYNGLVTVYPLTLEVEPTSCSSMQYKTQEGISMRLQVRSVEEVPPAHVPMGTLIERLGEAFDRLNGHPSSCGCKACGINLLKRDVKFTRVLSLPSKHWEDLSSSWTCCSHNHGNELKCEPQKLRLDEYPFVPRIGEFFENEFFLIFYPKAVVRNNVLLYPPNKSGNNEKLKKLKYEKSLMKCGRCLAVVGEALVIDSKTVKTYNFYKSSVEFKSHSERIPRPIFSSTFFLERVLANEITNEVKMNATYKFTLQDEKKKPYLLIRVLSTDTRIRMHSSHCMQTISKNNSAFGICSIPRRYLGSDEIELKTPKLDKSEKQRALRDSQKLLDKVMAFLHMLEEPTPERGLKPENGEHVSQEKRQNLVSPDVRALFAFSSNQLTLSRSCEDGPVNISCGLERVVKVMYTYAGSEPGGKVAKDWQKDIHVCALTLPYSLCMEALLILAASTLSLPISRRIAPDDFLFGALRIE